MLYHIIHWDRSPAFWTHWGRASVPIALLDGDPAPMIFPAEGLTPNVLDGPKPTSPDNHTPKSLCGGLLACLNQGKESHLETKEATQMISEVPLGSSSLVLKTSACSQPNNSMVSSYKIQEFW